VRPRGWHLLKTVRDGERVEECARVTVGAMCEGCGHEPVRSPFGRTASCVKCKEDVASGRPASVGQDIPLGGTSAGMILNQERDDSILLTKFRIGQRRQWLRDQETDEKESNHCCRRVGSKRPNGSRLSCGRLARRALRS